ncbi:hypothetical protein TorRG33x02_347770 [Trema orientale]|uniref:Uncharacterized protein n=1 Tax=Trema orientale TaxID=63057 RepID=A0A2P5AL23_TREOI|nr:hypothetical protein TorRG33x02_347770 [Trema orientale]
MQHHQYPENLDNLKFKDDDIGKLSVARSKLVKSNPSNGEQRHEIKKQQSEPGPSTQNPNFLKPNVLNQQRKNGNKSTEKSFNEDQSTIKSNEDSIITFGKYHQQSKL